MSQDEDFSELVIDFQNDYDHSNLLSAMNGSVQLESSNSSSGETSTFEESSYGYELPSVYPLENSENYLAQDWQSFGATQFYASSQHDLETIL